jgi:hypothetical protein
LITLAEVRVCARALPCFSNWSEVAEWLNGLHRTGHLPLFGDGVEIPPASNQNGMVRIVARDVPGDLEVQVSGGWDPRWTRSLDQMEWTFGREKFEVHLAKLAAGLAARQAPRREPTGWQAVPVLQWLRAKYRPDGKVPRRKTYKELRDEMGRDPHVIAELKRTGRALPSEDAIGRVVKYLGRSD